MKHSCLLILLLLSTVALVAGQASVEIIRDQWGVPHIYADSEADGFFGVGYAAAADRIVQMELFRRRSRGRLAEIFGRELVATDRKFRLAGVSQYCDQAAANLPSDIRSIFRSYAAGVNAFVRNNPETVARRFAALEIQPSPWREGDCVCAWMAVAELFDRLYSTAAVSRYHQFADLAAEVGEVEALGQFGSVIDDEAAVVPESEMAKNPGIYADLKATPPTPGQWRRSFPDSELTFSHAWAVGAQRSATGRPILESDPQTPVNNPPIWYEFHLSAGRFDVRGVGVAGSPGMLIGFNRLVAWGASALGVGSTITFVDRLSSDGGGYRFAGETLPVERRQEMIDVKGAGAVSVTARRTRHGFVFNQFVKNRREGELYVSHHQQIENGATSIVGLIGMMGAGDWDQFRDAMKWYYSPGIHVVYADVHGNIGYQTLVSVPRTKRTRRMALEGWRGDDEIMGRIPLGEMPNMLNPDAGFISHASNLPVGSWYPHDLGIGSGGTGHSNRSWRLVQLLGSQPSFTPEEFESAVHRDDVQANVATLFPIARRVTLEEGIANRGVERLLSQLATWDLRYRASQPAYPAAMALASSALTAFRPSELKHVVGGGNGGISHLARLLERDFGGSESTPSNRLVRQYLTAWLQLAAENLRRGKGTGPAPADGVSREIHRMPYQQQGPMNLPVLQPQHDLVSPPLACGQFGTIWSQKGNSYTQIVDLSDIDNSRAILPPGISEDPESPFHANQMQIWADGASRPAPISRARIEAIATSTQTLDVEPYDVQPPSLLSADGSGEGLAAAHVQRIGADGAQSIEPAIRWYENSVGFVAEPIEPSEAGEQVYLILFGAGIRSRSALAAVTATVGGVDLPASYAGPQGSYPDVDQVNVPLPRSLVGAGRVQITLRVDGLRTNAVFLVIR
ncbi:MAG: hypothetical protein GY953_43170 [bacterium]|nr:hypothetical protein [bacterium]